MKPSRDEMIKFLHEHGWREDRHTLSLWRFYETKYPSAKFKLKDAYELEKGRHS